MNEIELIRAQLSLERQHAAAISHALSAAATRGRDRLATLDAFRDASVDYLVWILSRFEEREQVFHDLVRTKLSADDRNRQLVEAPFSLSGTSREALAKLEAALGGQAAVWADFLLFFDGPWSARRDALDRVFAQLPPMGQAKVTDWRTVSGIDADSILDERNRYARVRATLPDGVELPAATSRG